MPESQIVLPDPPAALAGAPVQAWDEPVMIDTYEVGAPTPYPEFLSARVFQGSRGTVFPLPFFDTISHQKVPRAWRAVHLMNAYVRLMILPELGGRVQVGVDLTNGYDFFYRNNVIKPALVGLTGPWVSGGVEFNWPQHHRPATYLPTDYAIEHEPDGAVTVWCSDLDPFARMKGMHGLRLRPDSALIELRVRAFNRTEDVQTFLWWSNVAAQVGDDYQSFFPPDVTMVADHAKRACAAFPQVTGSYYGVDYPARVDAEHPDADRLDWYRNIPVPTSYMIVGTQEDFFGGYDHGREAGFVYWADHRIAPGKKQWTWGNDPFGWAWDRQLTDTDGPYVELMAGAFTDNQPDFSWLLPGETKTFSQYWYPIQQIGPAQAATLDAALALAVRAGRVWLGAAVTAGRAGAVAKVVTGEVVLWEGAADLAPNRPLVADFAYEPDGRPLTFTLHHDGQELCRYTWQPPAGGPLTPAELPVLATAIPAPTQLGSVEELVLSATHLEQYRHATRSPEPYLLEALRRDPGNSQALVHLSARRYREGRYQVAADLAQRALDRLTVRNPNPASGEAAYRLGLALRRLGRPKAAAEAMVKASWDAAWRAPALTAVATDCLAAGEYEVAISHLKQALVTQADDNRTRNLLAWATRVRPGGGPAADAILAETLARDPLDWWAWDLSGQPLETDPQTLLDLAGEYVRIADWAAVARLAGLAAERASSANPGMTGVLPLAHWYRARALAESGEETAAAALLRAAAQVDRGSCQLGRLDDLDLAVWVSRSAAGSEDPTVWALLGNWCYHVGRFDDAIAYWRQAVDLDAADAVSWRNLGMASYNVCGDPQAARTAYERALALRPDDSKLRSEYDQLLGRLGVAVADRLAELGGCPALVAQRDDLTVTMAELSTIAGDPQTAVRLLTTRQFRPWEGGEGRVLAAWEHAHLALARRDPGSAVGQLRAALTPPENLGEGRHPLANASNLWLALGDALAAAGEVDAARAQWQLAACFQGDFQQMAVKSFSDLTYYSVLAWRRLGRADRAAELLEGLERHVVQAADATPEIDYFATSLPTMLLFAEDLARTQAQQLCVLRAQIADLRGRPDEAHRLLAELRRRDPADPRTVLVETNPA